MPKRVVKFDLDFNNNDFFTKFKIKQFDNATLEISLKNIIVGASCLCKLYIGVNNELFAQDKGIQISSDKVIIDIDKNILSEKGKAYAELEFTDSNGVSTSTTFIFDIEVKIGEGANIPGNIEGFVSKYERLIAEFKAKVDSTLSQLQSDYNSTKNEVVNKTDDKIDEMEDRFNTLTSSQQQDSEVIDARNGETSLKSRLDKTDSQLDAIAKYDVVIGLGCDNTGKTEIGDIIQTFLDNENSDNINLYFPPGIYKWNFTVTTAKTLFINGERGNVKIINDGDLACLKHSGDCSLNGLIFNTNSTKRTEFTVYSTNGGEFLCYDTVFTCSSGKINGLHIENTTISHVDRCKFNHSQISLKTWDCKITNTWVWALWRPYGIGIHGGCGNITISNVDIVPPFRTPSGDLSSTTLVEGIKGGIWINSEGGNVSNNVIMENIYLDGNPTLNTGVGLLFENVFGVTLSSFRANKMNDYPIVIIGCYNVLISKGVFFENNKLDLTSKNEILIKNPDVRKCDNITLTDNHFINYKSNYSNGCPAIRVDSDVNSEVTIKYNNICQNSGDNSAYGNNEIMTPSMSNLSTNKNTKNRCFIEGSFTLKSGANGVSLTLPRFMIKKPTQQNFRFWVGNDFLPNLRVQENSTNNVWIGVQTPTTKDIIIHYEVKI